MSIKNQTTGKLGKWEPGFKARENYQQRLGE